MPRTYQLDKTLLVGQCRTPHPQGPQLPSPPELGRRRELAQWLVLGLLHMGLRLKRPLSHCQHMALGLGLELDIAQEVLRLGLGA